MLKWLSPGRLARPRGSGPSRPSGDFVVGDDGGPPSAGPHGETLDAVIERAQARQIAAAERAVLAQRECEELLASGGQDATNAARDADERRAAATGEALALLRQLRILETVRDESQAAASGRQPHDDGNDDYDDDYDDHDAGVVQETNDDNNNQEFSVSQRKSNKWARRYRNNDPVDDAVQDDIDQGWHEPPIQADADKVNAHAKRLEDRARREEMTEREREALEDEVARRQDEAEEAREDVIEAIEQAKDQARDVEAAQAILTQSVNPEFDQLIEEEFDQIQNGDIYQTQVAG